MSSMETQKIEASFISLRIEKVESTNLWVPQLLLIYFRPEKVIVFSEVFDVFAGFVSSLSDEFDGLWIQIWLF